MSAKEVSAQLKALIGNYNEIEEICQAYYDEAEERTAPPPQPKVKKADGSLFDIDECVALANDNYTHESSLILDLLEEEDSCRSQFFSHIKPDEEAVELARFYPAKFYSLHSEPEKKVAKPKYPYTYTGYVSKTGAIISIIAFVLASLMLVFILTNPPIRQRASQHLQNATIVAQQVNALFEEEEYLAWRTLWDGKNKTDYLIGQWSPVEEAWKLLNFEVGRDDVQQALTNVEKDKVVRLDDFEEELLFLICDKYVEDSKYIAWENGTYVRSSRWNGWNITKLVFCWIGLVAFALCSFFFGYTFVDDTLTDRRLKIKHKTAFEEYINEECPRVEAQNAQYEIEYQEELKKYNEIIKDERAEHEAEQVQKEKEFYKKQLKNIEAYKKEVEKWKISCELSLKEKEERLAELDKRYNKVTKTIATAYPDLPEEYTDITLGKLTEQLRLLRTGEGDIEVCQLLFKYLFVATRNKAQKLLDILRSGRVETLKEAIDCSIEEERHAEQMNILAEAEEERNRILEERAEAESQQRMHELKMQRAHEEAMREEEYERQQEQIRHNREMELSQQRIQQEIRCGTCSSASSCPFRGRKTNCYDNK